MLRVQHGPQSVARQAVKSMPKMTLYLCVMLAGLQRCCGIGSLVGYHAIVQTDGGARQCLAG